MGKTGEVKTGESKTGDVTETSASATLTGGSTLTADAAPVLSADFSGGSTLTADTGFVQPHTSSGWAVVVIHPTTGRRIRPDVLDEPGKRPSLNTLPEIRIPVRKSAAWLDPSLEDDPEMAVWMDGERQPIDTLREVEDREGHTVLVGVGGTELEGRVTQEYRSEERHVAAKGLITSETSYAEDVDTPNFETRTDELQQGPDTQSELEGVLSIDDETPLQITSGEVTTRQSCFVGEWSDLLASTGDVFQVDDGSYSDGTAWSIESSGEWVEFEFSPTYDIPGDASATQSDVGFQVRAEGGSVGNEPEVELQYLNSSGTWETIDTRTAGGTSLSWREFATGDIGKLGSGTQKIRLQVTNTADPFVVDVLAIYDDRYNYTFDTSVHQTDGYLDGPETHPDAVEVLPDRAVSPFTVTAGKADLTIDDTTNDQRLQISNDNGQNWLPDDGTENNTSSVDVDFPDTGASTRMRVDLSRYSPSGAQSQTPRFGYDGQALDAWDLFADIRLQWLLIDERFDADLASILTDIAGNEYLWSYNLDDNGDPRVSWTQPGTRTATRDPDIGSVDLTKIIGTFGKVTIKGSNRDISGETFTASTSFVDLNRDDIVVGSETVYNDATGTNFDRGPDYEMDYGDGRIRIVSGGDLSSGTDYSVDYSVETSGSFTESGAGSDPREFVDTIAAVTSDRQAEQIAWVLQEESADPRYEGDLTIPRGDVSFDPLEALSLDNLDLPDNATPLEVRGDPEIATSGVQVRLGSRGRLERSISTIADQLRQVAEKT